MNKGDLLKATETLSKALQLATRLKLQPFDHRSGTKYNDNSGWYIKILSLNNDLSIYLFLDNYLDSTQEHAFWAGFYSEKKETLRDIAFKYRIAYQIEVEELFSDDIPQLDDLDRLYVEYFDNNECYFGCYSYPGQAFSLGRTLQFLCDTLRAIPDFRTFVRLDTADLDIFEVENDPSIRDTEREQIILARRGQGKYRKGLDQLWDEKCAVLGVSHPSALRASHIKPWKVASSIERLDPNNGLLLTASMDALFDKFLITFGASGEMKISESISTNDRQILGLGKPLRKLPTKTASFLEYHRGEFEKKEDLRKKDQALLLNQPLT